MPGIQGQGGVLLVGTRVATTLNAWTMTAIERQPEKTEPPKLQLIAGGHKDDPVWWPRVPAARQLYLRIKLGKTEVEKRAVLVNTNPLTLHIWENDEDAPAD